MPPGSKLPPLKPVLSGVVPQKAQRPLAGLVPPKKKWRFNFRYWRQVEYFGVDQCDKAWFVAVLQRLMEVSNLDVDDVISGSYGASMRCHPIDWAARNIPIAKKNIDWLGDQSLEDIDFLQFSISTGRGRIIGFLDADHAFNVVLLDPMHNLQPAKKHNYQVRTTYISQCAITKLSVTFNNMILNCPYLLPVQQDELLAQLREQNTRYFDAVVHLSISDEHLKKAYQFARLGLISNLGELLEATIDSLPQIE